MHAHTNALNLSLFFCSQVFKTKAADLARKLLPAFNTPTGIPKSLINLRKYETHKTHITHTYTSASVLGVANSPNFYT